MNAETKAQLAEASHYCRTCRTDSRVKDCPDWCPRANGACDCRHPLCGECMRHMGTAGSGIGYARP